MADRRMLWKSVSQSKKVNALSLPAAFLWTWCIPWFDRDGYMEADADFIKYNVVPRRRELDESSIPTLVQEIIDSGLWISFLDEEGKLVVKERAFKDHQRIEYNKEMKSKWEGKKLNSTTTRRPLDDHSSQNKIKVVEERLNKGKGRECEGNQNQDHPVDNHPTSQEVPFDPPEQENPLAEKDNGKDNEQKRAQWERQFLVLQNRLLTKWPRFNLQLFFQNNIQKNRDAIIHSLQQTLDRCTSSDPRTYAQKVLDIESGNFNEAESIKESNNNKNLFDLIISGIKQF